MPNYEPFHEIPNALGVIALYGALARCGYHPPMLYIGSPGNLSGIACQLQHSHGINWDYDPELGENEWYVEWNGKRFGSEGC